MQVIRIVGSSSIWPDSALVCAPSPSMSADKGFQGDIPRLAMSTASVFMVDRHEHEIAEALEKGDLMEAVSGAGGHPR